MDESINKPVVEEKNPLEERMQKLAADKKLAEEAKAQAEARAQQMEKENSFLNSFSDVIVKFPTATEYKDKIKEKVMGGYSVDDATVSILHAEGKLTPQSPAPDAGMIAGGSASNQFTNNGTKPIADMSREEKWAALKEAERKGDLSMR
jgi:hypothetical protein